MPDTSLPWQHPKTMTPMKRRYYLLGLEQSAYVLAELAGTSSSAVAELAYRRASDRIAEMIKEARSV